MFQTVLLGYAPQFGLNPGVGSEEAAAFFQVRNFYSFGCGRSNGICLQLLLTNFFLWNFIFRREQSDSDESESLLIQN